ncbi:WhiB family transcriptional regulator [Streptomyces sp. CB03911]|uniref:WhiB family transcriptional regulator n=1 Tax=Streptomyces sp. CB03911 TaxID=1804758 RepID=UPI0025710F04|nr:WhiB family transcriptional regulator [Streptomyces sp. CB03911]
MPETATNGGEANPRPCAGLDLNLFFPAVESTDYTRPNAREKAALKICAACPLAARTACLTDALTHPISDQYGVSGNTTAVQRQTILRGRKVAQLAGVAA